MITIVIYGPQAVGKSALAKWLAEQLKHHPPQHVKPSETFALLSSQGEPVCPGAIEVEATGVVGSIPKHQFDYQRRAMGVGVCAAVPCSGCEACL